MWHLDLLHRHIHKQKVYTLLIVDDISRLVLLIADGRRDMQTLLERRLLRI